MSKLRTSVFVFALGILSRVPASAVGESPGDIILGARVVDAPASRDGFRPGGVKVIRVFGGPLAIAGISDGDIIVAVDEQPANSEGLGKASNAGNGTKISLRFVHFDQGCWKSKTSAATVALNDAATNRRIEAYQSSRVRESEKRIWDFPFGLKGTPEQIGDQMNTDTEAAWARRFDAKSKLDEKLSEIETKTSAVLAPVRGSEGYKNIEAELQAAQKAAAAARAKNDNRSALSQSGIAKLAKAKLVKIEADAISDDKALSDAAAALPELRRGVQARDEALDTAARARSKLLYAIMSGARPSWPIRVDDELFVQGGQVIQATDVSVTLHAVAFEYNGIAAKNAIGDGIDVVQVHTHPIALKIPFPAGKKPRADDVIQVNAVFTVTKDEKLAGVDTIDCAADDDGPFAVLLQSANNIRGPGADYLAAVDKKVAASIESKLEGTP